VKLSVFPALLFAFASAAFADGVVIYSSIPSNTQFPPNAPPAAFLYSDGYEAQGVSEFGGLIQFAGGASTYSLANATVGVSDYALASGFEDYIDGTLAPPADYTVTSSGFYVPMTLTIYSVGAGHYPDGSGGATGSPAVGSPVATVTTDAFIPWRPAGNSSCPIAYGHHGWQDTSGGCHNGALSTVPFNLAGASVPGQVIWSLSFSTTDHPAGHTTGFAGPDNSLNIQLVEGLPEVGSNPLPDTVYLDASNGSSYNDNGAGGTGAFRPDSGWSPYGTGAIEFTDDPVSAPTPEPSSLVLFATGLFSLAAIILGKGRARGAGVKP
jgi:hypothetical protein